MPLPIHIRYSGWSVAAMLMLIGSLMAATSVAMAASTSWIEKKGASLRLISAQRSVGKAEELLFGLHFKLAPGWKTYWRSPGEAGIALRVQWEKSINVAGVQLHWPAPIRFKSFGIESVGYEGEVVLPMAVTLQRPGAPVRFEASLIYGTCAKTCIQNSDRLSLQLPAGQGQPAAEAGLIRQYLARVPKPSHEQGFAIAEVAVTGEGEGARLHVKISSRMAFGRPELFVDGPRDFAFNGARPVISKGGAEARFDIPVVPLGDDELSGARLLFTIIDGDRMSELAHQLQKR